MNDVDDLPRLPDAELDLDILCTAFRFEHAREQRLAAMTPAERLAAPDPGEELPRREWSSIELREMAVVFDTARRSARNLDRAADLVGLPSGLDLMLLIGKIDRVLRARGEA